MIRSSTFHNRPDNKGTLPPRARYLLLAALAACLSLLVSGCLFDRVIAVKQDMCEFDAHFALETSEDLKLTFKHPVLLDSDIRWLADTQPTRVEESGQTLTMTYLVEKISDEPNPDHQFPIELSFSLVDDAYRLQEIQSEIGLSPLIDPQFIRELLVESMADQICQAGISFASTRMEYDIAAEHIALLPERQEIVDFLGEPTTRRPDDLEWNYEFRVVNDDPGANVAILSLWFSPEIDELTRMQTEYSRYLSHADFAQRKLRMRLAL